MEQFVNALTDTMNTGSPGILMGLGGAGMVRSFVKADDTMFKLAALVIIIGFLMKIGIIVKDTTESTKELINASLLVQENALNAMVELIGLFWNIVHSGAPTLITLGSVAFHTYFDLYGELKVIPLPWPRKNTSFNQYLAECYIDNFQCNAGLEPALLIDVCSSFAYVNDAANIYYKEDMTRSIELTWQHDLTIEVHPFFQFLHQHDVYDVSKYVIQMQYDHTKYSVFRILMSHCLKHIHPNSAYRNWLAEKQAQLLSGTMNDPIMALEVLIWNDIEMIHNTLDKFQEKYQLSLEKYKKKATTCNNDTLCILRQQEILVAEATRPLALE